MAAAISRTFGLDTDLIRGSGGVYKVWADGNLLWDKGSTGRFPEENEILDKLREVKD